MVVLFLTIGILGILLCLTDERIGFFICILAGFLQEIVRKILPGEPVYVTVSVGAFVAATLLGVRMRGAPINLNLIYFDQPRLKNPLKVFILLVLIQGTVTIVKTGNLVVAGIGLLAYFAPLVTVLLGFYMIRIGLDSSKYLQFYAIIAFFMITGTFLSALGFNWDILDAVGVGLHAYATEATGGGVLELHGGFFRGSELAGWHGATAASFLVILSLSHWGKSNWKWWGTTIIVLILLFAVLLTGRRKFLVAFILFLTLYGLLLYYFSVGFRQWSRWLVVVLTIGALGIILIDSERWNDIVIHYVDRGLQVQDEASHRVINVGILTLPIVIDKNGWFGAGAGMGSQGAQYFGGGAQIVGGAAEGGIAKIVGELGIPGLAILLWVLYAFASHLLKVVRYVRSLSETQTRLVCGLIAFFAANTAVFLTSHQIYGDLFVLTILGWLLGGTIAIPYLVYTQFWQIE